MKRLVKAGRIILWTAGTLLAVAAACLLLIAIAAGNETASRRLLLYASGQAGIEIERMSGALATGMTLENVRYSGGAVEVRIGELDFDWQPWALLHGTAEFRSLRLDRVRIEYVPADPAPEAAKKMEFPDFSLPLRISIAEADAHDLRLDYGEREFELDHIHLDAALGSTLRLNRLTLQAPRYELSAEGSIDGGFPYDGELAVEWRYRPGTGDPLAGIADIAGDLNRLEVEHRLTAPMEIRTAGEIVTGIVDGAPRAELDNRWQGLRLQPPLVPFSMESTGELRITGWLSDYRLHGQGEAAVESARVPSFGFSLDAGGDLAGLDTLDLELATLEGTIAASGAVKWAPGFEWRADIAAEKVDLTRYHRQLPSELQLDFHTEGARRDGEWHGRLEDIRGAGQAGAYPVGLQGDLEFKGQAFSSSSLKLSIAENTLTLSGGINRRLDLQWELGAPRLAALWPRLEGALSGGGRITGSRDSPRFKAAVSGGKLAYGDYRIDRLTAALQTEKPSQHVLTLNAEQVMLWGRTLSAFTVNARGGAASHVVESRIQDDYLAASALIEGGYRDSHWQGTLRSARWRSGNLSEWSLQQAVDVSAGPRGVRIGHACWTAEQARLCAQLDTGGNEIRGEASLASVPAALLDPWLPPPVDIEGEIRGMLSVNGPNWEDLTGKLELEAPAGRVGVRREGMPTDDYRWENALFQAKLRDRRLNATVNLTFPGYGAAGSAASLDLRDRSLDGAISARFDNLAPLQTVITDLDELQGSLQVSVELGGTLDRPRFAGSLRLQQASARIPRLGIQIHGVEFSAGSDNGSDAVFKGRAESGGGSLEISGKLAYSPTPRVEATVEGEAFQILRQPQVRASISPQLHIQARPRQVSIRGAVRIPSARIEILEPPESIVAVSEDVIIVDADSGPDRRPENGLQLTAQVRLILGDDVQFQGFGFNTGVDGELTVDKTAGRPVAATGELRVKQGQYKAFGQQLDIDRGRLLFQGPYDNPGLDILAVRKTPDVTVSLEIGGTLESPRSRVFSEPPLPDSEAMAILLTGKPLGSASESDANMLVNAIAGLGLRQGKFITDDIARAFNLDEFNIKTESDVTASSLFIGKQISPRLFIRYIVGLFDQTSRIGLSYRLSRHLRLEAESGWNQSMDLIYEIER